MTTTAAVASAAPAPIVHVLDDTPPASDSSSIRIDGAPCLFIGGARLATGAVISPRHILTAAHCFDADADGKNDIGTDVAVFFDVASERAVVVTPAEIERVTLHPDFTGFMHPGVHDDLAIITLTSPLPPHIPVHALHSGATPPGATILLAGYGQADAPGSASFTHIRIGANAADEFYTDDEGAGALEVWRCDFDGPDGDGACGGRTLGPGVEATLGEGDSGGPGFIVVDGRLLLFSVNTFTLPSAGHGAAETPGAGGQILAAYADWIHSVIARDGASLEDIDRDGRVGAADLAAILRQWGGRDAAADINADGIVDAADLARVLRAQNR